MQLGIFAKTFDGKSPGVVLPQVAAAGFSVAQYNLACSGLSSMPDTIDDSVLEDVRHAVAASGVSLNALSATYNMIHPERNVRDKGHARLAVVAKAAHDLGVPTITLCTGSRDATDQWRHHPDNASTEAWRDLIASMHIAIEIAERYNLNLGIEPELANVVSGAMSAKRLIDECTSQRIKIVLDAANLFEVESAAEQRRIVAEAVDMLGPHIIMAHAKDRKADGTFVAAGTGVLDYPHFLRALKNAGFKGPIVTHGLRAAEAPAVSLFLRQQLSAADIEIDT
jgi:sugar phosphate isomerase/epimerase